jgi:GMP synthase (glutamine-hydrolysing)
MGGVDLNRAPLTAVAVRHVAFEDLGILEPVLTERGYSVTYRDAGVDDLGDALTRSADLLVVLGGPIGVYQTEEYPVLEDELALLRSRLDEGAPTFGICLGAQLMARALGADVHRTGRTEIGYGPVSLTREGETSVLGALADVPVLHWHGDEFDIPAGGRALAETPGFPHQAFAVGSRVLGLQFHLEVDASRIERWLIGHASELAAADIRPSVLRAEALRYGPQLAQSAVTVFDAWLDQVALSWPV